jgi:hypothetical protein
MARSGLLHMNLEIYYRYVIDLNGFESSGTIFTKGSRKSRFF